MTTTNTASKPILHALRGQNTERVPFWLMRQAGRYLPEYRELRARMNGFLHMALDPDAACEITLQPLRRFGMDGAVIFSDILVVPMALGQRLEFREGEGPHLGALPDLANPDFESLAKNLAPVYEALRLTKSALTREGFPHTALIGFAGAPWTLASYMIDGNSHADFIKTRSMACREPENFNALIAVLTDAVARHLSAQIEAGAEVVQIFDSWAGLADSTQFRRWIIEPTKKIVAGLKAHHPDVPVIGFPRAAGSGYEAYARETGVTAVGIDSQIAPEWAAQHLQPHTAVQGNLEPLRLLAGGETLEQETRRILGMLAGGRFVFNLGHGVHKDTPVAHVETLAKILQDFQR